MPCSGLRSKAPERKPPVLQCQKVQNQTKDTILWGDLCYLASGVGRRMNRKGMGSVTLSASHAAARSLGSSTSKRYSSSPDRSADADRIGRSPASDTKVTSKVGSFRGIGASWN